MKETKLAVALALFCAAAALGQDSERDAVRTKIMALENAWNQAELLRDARSMDSIFDDSMIYVDSTGKLFAKAEFLANLKAGRTRPQSLVTESMKVSVFGDTAIVIGIYRESGMENGHPYQHRGRFTDVWVHKDGRWLCVASQATPVAP